MNSANATPHTGGAPDSGQSGQDRPDHCVAEPGLAITELSVSYSASVVLGPLSLTMGRGELIALVGPNGAGKSSLLKAIAGVVSHHGTMIWDGRRLADLSSRERALQLSYLPQTPTAHWPMRARDLVALGRLPHRRYGTSGDAADSEAIDRAMACTDVTALAGRSIDTLSGGERTRVLLARALAVNAPVLLADEPVASLDPYHQLKIMSALAGCAAQGALVVAVLHDLALAARFCTRMILISEGRLRGDGAPESVLSDEALHDHYRVLPYLARHENEPVILPWRTIG